MCPAAKRGGGALRIPHVTPIARLTAAAALTLTAGLAGCSPSPDAAPAATPSTASTASSNSAAPPTPSATSAPSTTGSPSPGSTTAAGTATIRIKSFAYLDRPAVAPGATVTVTNRDAEAHTITADKGSAFDSTVDGGGDGRTKFRAPDKPGRYRFHCQLHDMHGVLVVR